MKRYLFITFFIFLIIVTDLSLISAKPKDLMMIHNGFLTGASYLALPLSSRQDIVTGIVEGMLVAPLLGAPDNKKPYKLGQCIESKSNREIEIIVTTFARNNSDRLLQNIGILTYSALDGACGGF